MSNCLNIEPGTFGRGTFFILSKTQGQVLGFAQKVLIGAGSFTASGFKKAIREISSLFSHETQESIYADETNVRQAEISVSGNTWRWRSGDSVVEYDSQSDRIFESFGVDGSARIEGLKQDEAGRISYEKLSYKTALGGGDTVFQEYEKGKLRRWMVASGGLPVLSVSNAESNVVSAIDETGMFRSSEIEVFNPVEIKGPEGEEIPSRLYLPSTVKLKTEDGRIQDAKVEIGSSISSGASASESVPDRELYALVNGFLNDSTFDAPDYLYNLKNDVVDRSEREIKPDDVALAPTYFASPWLKVLEAAGTVSNILSGGVLSLIEDMLFGAASNTGTNLARNLASFIAENTSTQSMGSIASDIKRGLDLHFKKIGQQNRSREMVGVGYSGGFLPMAEVFAAEVYNEQSGAGYNACALVALGAANIDVPEAGRALADESSFLMDVLQKLDKMSSVTEKVLEYIQKGLEKMVQTMKSIHSVFAGASFVDQMMALLRQGTAFYGQARDFMKAKVQEVVRFLQTAPVFNIASTPMDLLVNVYGTQDVLREFGEAGQKIGGFKTNIGGFEVGDRNEALVNIEILGAGHGDYMRGDSPLAIFNTGFLGVGADLIYSQLTGAETEWIKTVSEFVADVVINSKNADTLESFLRRTNTAKEEGSGANKKWVIKLPGYEGRQ